MQLKSGQEITHEEGSGMRKVRLICNAISFVGLIATLFISLLWKLTDVSELAPILGVSFIITAIACIASAIFFFTYTGYNNHEW